MADWGNDEDEADDYYQVDDFGEDDDDWGESAEKPSNAQPGAPSPKTKPANVESHPEKDKSIVKGAEDEDADDYYDDEFDDFEAESPKKNASQSHKRETPPPAKDISTIKSKETYNDDDYEEEEFEVFTI